MEGQRPCGQQGTESKLPQGARYGRLVAGNVDAAGLGGDGADLGGEGTAGG
jgi:hypothetical protein